ncbi:hypothetical protein [Spiroplasma chrysopicola]|uniref:Uncharacterized protein n=1 Tax=Spiroplasma chrysopicola DF-1 TaxID=1276227 RepID=R4UJJ6_9MOLU|nr:hypothetical protein [Spiroplasma chrysopicola]AGM25481.1 hypothetical protein SCHRY_v1c09080 [Spiroplasma chrysopicola DF-1]
MSKRETIFELHEVIGFDDNGNYDENYDKLLYTFTSYEDAQNELNYQVEHGYAPSELEIQEEEIDYDINQNKNYLETLEHLKRVEQNYQKEVFKDAISDLDQEFRTNEIGIVGISSKLIKIGFSAEQVLDWETKAKTLNTNNEILIEQNENEELRVPFDNYLKSLKPEYGLQLFQNEGAFKEYESEFKKYLSAKEIQNKEFEAKREEMEWE